MTAVSRTLMDHGVIRLSHHQPLQALRITHISCGASAILAKYPIHLGDFVKYQKPSPHNGGAGRVIMLAVQIATEFGNPQYDFAERGRGNRWL